LWFFSVPPIPIPPTPPNTALFSLRCLPQARFVSYLHRCFGSPSLSTFLRALSRGYIHGIPQLTHTLVRKFPPLSLATAFGHLDQLRQGVASSRKIPPPRCFPSFPTLPTPPHIIPSDQKDKKRQRHETTPTRPFPHPCLCPSLLRPC
jgi:hypothetical protein